MGQNNGYLGARRRKDRLGNRNSAVLYLDCICVSLVYVSVKNPYWFTLDLCLHLTCTNIYLRRNVRKSSYELVIGKMEIFLSTCII